MEMSERWSSSCCLAIYSGAAGVDLGIYTFFSSVSYLSWKFTIQCTANYVRFNYKN